MKLRVNLEELVDNNVITQESSTAIQYFYKNSKTTNTTILIFGVIGALLVGLGIVLIIAHNWDDLSRLTRTILAFLPLLFSQLMAWYVYKRKMNSATWRESSSILMFFGIGACMGLISQLYPVDNDFGKFLLIWTFLALPVVYLFKSQVASMLCLVWGSWYAFQYDPFDEGQRPWMYFAVFSSLLPFYYWQMREKPTSLVTRFHHWLFPISILITIWTFIFDCKQTLFFIYFLILGFYFILVRTSIFKNYSDTNRSYSTIGMIGMVGLLFFFSYDFSWQFDTSKLILSLSFWITCLILLSGIIWASYDSYIRNIDLFKIDWIVYFLLISFTLFYFLGFQIQSINYIFNALILVVLVYYIHRGAEELNLKKLNFGLLVFAILISVRFIDTDIGFLTRGLLFMVVGAGFFAANYWLIKKQKRN
jgi:uncharacterized membrane protein